MYALISLTISTSRRLRISESETLRMALMDYAKELNLLGEKVHKMGNPTV
mgnify:CR=1 FL=1